jgi:urea transport system substrate-binding protein
MAKTILVAATDPNIAYLLQRYAEESGFETLKTGQNHAALDLARATKPALIILEVEVPYAASWRMLDWLKTEPQTCHIPVVVYSFLDEELDGPPPGVAGYLKKSILYDDFLSMLNHVGVRP